MAQGRDLPQEPLGDPRRAAVGLQLSEGRLSHLSHHHPGHERLGKHLDKEKGQDDPLNRAILEVLEKLSELEAADNREMEEVAIHAAGIRNAFFDDKKRMDDVIPPVLLVTVSDRNEVPPRRKMAVADERVSRSAARAAAAEAKEKKDEKKEG